MPDKIGPLEMPAEEVPRFYAGIINKLGDERDMLRAETDHLKRLLIDITDERDDLRAQITTLEWQLSEATKAAETLKQRLSDAGVLYASRMEASLGNKALLDQAIDENGRLRAAAQWVIDSINDENEISTAAIANLSQMLVRPNHHDV